MKRSQIGVLGAALLALTATFSNAQAQKTVDPGEVTILNDHIDVHQVYVFDAQGRRHSLGMIGHQELKTFAIPEKVKAMGPYRVAVQAWTPLPGIGVSAEAPPMKMTGSLNPAPGEVVAIIFGNETDLSSVQIFPAVNTYQQYQQYQQF